MLERTRTQSHRRSLSLSGCFQHSSNWLDLKGEGRGGGGGGGLPQYGYVTQSEVPYHDRCVAGYVL